MILKWYYGKESKKMNRFLSNNVAWKIISLLLATLLWFFVINYQNPELTQEIRSNVTIRGINELEAKGYVLQNEEQLRDIQVRILLKGPRLEMERLKNDNVQIDVRLDLTQYANLLTEEDADSIEKPIQITAHTNIEGIVVEDIRPKTVGVIFEREEQATRNIHYTIENESNSEYAALDPILKPTTVEISGPKSSVEKVETAQIKINVDNFSEDVLSYTAPIMLLDDKGEEVVGVKKVPEYVEVTLPIGKKKTVPLEPQFKGVLPPGYIKANTLVSPQTITIVGKADIVDTIQSIKLEKIALENVIESNTFRTDFILPEGIEYIDNIEPKATVTLEIQKETDYNYEIPISELNLQVLGVPEGYTYEVLDDTVSIILASTAEKLLAFKPNQIQVTADLSSIKEGLEGEHRVPLQIVVPSDFKVVNVPLYLNISLKGPVEEVPVEPEVPPIEGEEEVTVEIQDQPIIEE